MKTRNLIIITLILINVAQGFQLRSYKKMTETAFAQSEELLVISKEAMTVADNNRLLFENCVKTNTKRDRR